MVVGPLRTTLLLLRVSKWFINLGLLSTECLWYKIKFKNTPMITLIILNSIKATLLALMEVFSFCKQCSLNYKSH